MVRVTRVRPEHELLSQERQGLCHSRGQDGLGASVEPAALRTARQRPSVSKPDGSRRMALDRDWTSDTCCRYCQVGAGSADDPTRHGFRAVGSDQRTVWHTEQDCLGMRRVGDHTSEEPSTGLLCATKHSREVSSCHRLRDGDRGPPDDGEACNVRTS
jgi:hypothetical protein